MQRWGCSKGGIVLNALTIWARGKTGPQRQVGGKLTFANRLFFCLVCACHGVLSLFFYRWPVFFTMSASLGTSSSHILHLLFSSALVAVKALNIPPIDHHKDILISILPTPFLFSEPVSTNYFSKTQTGSHCSSIQSTLALSLTSHAWLGNNLAWWLRIPALESEKAEFKY